MPKITYIRSHHDPPKNPVVPCYRIELLRRYREGRKLTYDTLAERVDIRPSTLRRMLSKDGIDSISAVNAFRLIAELGIPLEEAAEAWRKDGKEERCKN